MLAEIGAIKQTAKMQMSWSTCKKLKMTVINPIAMRHTAAKDELLNSSLTAKYVMMSSRRKNFISVIKLSNSAKLSNLSLSCALISSETPPIKLLKSVSIGSLYLVKLSNMTREMAQTVSEDICAYSIALKPESCRSVGKKKRVVARLILPATSIAYDKVLPACHSRTFLPII